MMQARGHVTGVYFIYLNSNKFVLHTKRPSTRKDTHRTSQQKCIIQIQIHLDNGFALYLDKLHFTYCMCSALMSIKTTSFFFRKQELADGYSCLQSNNLRQMLQLL